MLLCVGDSNCVALSYYLLHPDVNVSMCKKGWTSEQVLSAIRKHHSLLPSASACVVFTGMNDVTSGRGLADNVIRIVDRLRVGGSENLPIFVVPPFCVSSRTGEHTTSMCKSRQEAGHLIASHMSALRNCHVLAPHLSPRSHTLLQTMVRSLTPSKLDPLHMNEYGYRVIATSINQRLSVQVSVEKRVPKLTARARESYAARGKAPRRPPSPRRSSPRRARRRR